MAGLYLLVLVVSLSGLGLADWRYRLALFYDARRTLLALAIGLVFFVAWDAAGIALGIFFTGTSAYDTGLLLAPEFPVEELFFLLLLTYLPLLAWRGLARWR